MSKYYEPDLFYDLEPLSFKEKLNLCRYCKELSFEWWLDRLKSIQRQSTNINNFEEALIYAKEDSIFTFIHRKGFEHWKNNKFFSHNWCLEAGFRSMTTPDYFLWIYIDEDKLEDIINKFNIKEYNYE